MMTGRRRQLKAQRSELRGLTIGEIGRRRIYATKRRQEFAFLADTSVIDVPLYLINGFLLIRFVLCRAAAHNSQPLTNAKHCKMHIIS
jgi:hypothetical protein